MLQSPTIMMGGQLEKELTITLPLRVVDWLVSEALEDTALDDLNARELRMLAEVRGAKERAIDSQRQRSSIHQQTSAPTTREA